MPQVKGLEFNRVCPNLLASGGADSAINIWDLTNPHKPTNYPAQKVGYCATISVSAQVLRLRVMCCDCNGHGDMTR